MRLNGVPGAISASRLLSGNGLGRVKDVKKDDDGDRNTRDTAG